MLPDPLHPAVVHFPVVLAVLLPLFVLGGVLAVRRGAPPTRAWILPLLIALALTGTAWAALETGEDQEERVEEVVAEEPLHEHEEAGERFLLLSAVVTLVALGGLAGGTFGQAARLVTGLGSLGVLLAGIQTGNLGGELVYEHGAGSAYASQVDAGSSGDAASATDRTEGAAGAGTSVALPGLFRIMSGLQADMAGISRGLWTGELDLVASSATAVADHPMVPAEERARIAEVLGEDIARFQEFDRRVHDIAVRLGEQARADDVAGALQAEAELRAACVACHETFREPLREALTAPIPPDPTRRIP